MSPLTIPATIDDCLVFEDWCEEMRLHPLEMTCTDSDDLWVLGGYGWGDGFGYGYANYGNGYGNEFGNGFGSGYGYGWGDGFGSGNGDGGGYGSKWTTR